VKPPSRPEALAAAASSREPRANGVRGDGRAAAPRDGRGELAEAALVRSARGGDRAAFEALYERWAPTVQGVLLAMLPPGEVRDLHQEVFLCALGALGALDRPERFGPWLLSIARNRARDVLRARGRPEGRAAELPDELAGPERAPALDERDEAARILAMIRALPDAYRESLTLRLVEGLGGPEIAERIGMTPGSVRVNLCRGMKLLRERLAEEGLA